jgi:transposase
LPADHLAYLILDTLGELDLRAIEESVEAKEARGERPYAPAMMVALLLYSYCVGLFSPRKIARAIYPLFPGLPASLTALPR